MLLAHKIELRPTLQQASYLSQACGARRHCYNQLLAHFSQDGVKWSKAAAYQHYIQVLRIEYPWYADVSIRVTRNAIDDLASAFKHFFRRCRNGSKQKGFPTFKKKGVHDSFALREEQKFDIDGRTLRLEKLKTRIKMRQKLRFTGRAKQVTISHRAEKFFASVLVDTQDYNHHDPQQEAVGVDFGVKSLATLSNGDVFPANQKLKANLKRVKRRQRRLSKKQKGSNRYAKAKRSVTKLHYRIANQRQAVLHELSDNVTRNFKTICIEDLCVSGMLKNHKLARAVSDAGLGSLRSMLEYKSELRNVRLITTGRFEPSTRMCSSCGQLHDMQLGKDTMRCDCGNIMDRDHNAAINILNFGLQTLTADLKRTQEQRKTSSDAAVMTA